MFKLYIEIKLQGLLPICFNLDSFFSEIVGFFQKNYDGLQLFLRFHFL